MPLVVRRSFRAARGREQNMDQNRYDPISVRPMRTRNRFVATTEIFFVGGRIEFLARWSKSTGRDQCGQATKGAWGMSWRRKAMKGVEDCEKPGEAVKRASIPGFPN